VHFPILATQEKPSASAIIRMRTQAGVLRLGALEHIRQHRSWARQFECSSVPRSPTPVWRCALVVDKATAGVKVGGARYLGSEDPDAGPALLAVLDDFFVGIVLVDFVPEPRDLGAGFSGMFGNVVKRDHSTLAN
jgi:hypothetical protein